MKLHQSFRCWHFLLFYHSGSEEKSEQAEYELIPIRFSQCTVYINFCTIADRICPMNITIVLLHSPRLLADRSCKDDSYDQMPETFNGVSREDFVIVAGDWNAGFSSSNDGNHHIGNFKSDVLFKHLRKPPFERYSKNG